MTTGWQGNRGGGAAHHVVLLRHGESAWNRENRFTGWTDVDLSEKGVAEARAAGAALREQGFVFDLAFTSVLKRAIRTLWIVLDEMDLMWIPVVRDWRLNERHYGALQGLDKARTAEKYGDRQVKAWRRSYDVPPPPLAAGDPRCPDHDPRYRDLAQEDIPRAESLKDTVARFLPYWQEVIVPTIAAGKRVLIVAHGNSLRALVKSLDAVADDAIAEVNIPTGMPLIYELDASMQPIGSCYLGNPNTVKEAMEAVAGQGKGHQAEGGAP